MVSLRVLIVDDHPIMRRGLQITLAEGLSVDGVDEASDVEDALAAAQLRPPDLALVNGSLSRGNGLDLVRRLLTIRPDAKILVVSQHDPLVFAERALRAGALGYIEKTCSPVQLLEAVERILRGEISVAAEVVERLLRLGLKASREVATGIDDLTDRELEVLELIGHGHSTRHIAELLHLSIKTIETHREHIKSKLHFENVSELLRCAVLWTNGRM